MIYCFRTAFLYLKNFTIFYGCFLVVSYVVNIFGLNLLQIHDPSIATFYTNRALCYVKLNMWDQACQDCQHAIDLDNRLVKAHFFKGQALHELQLFDESIASFKRGQMNSAITAS